MQPVTIVENNPQREGYAENYNVGGATCASVMILLYAIGLAVCGGVGYIAGAIPISTILYDQICAFALGGLYLLTSIIGFGTSCRNMCMVRFFLTTCILSVIGSLTACGFFSYSIYLFVSPGINLEQCAECLYFLIPNCVSAFLSFIGFFTTLAGSIYCCQGMSSPDNRRTSQLLVAVPHQPQVINY
ncbi:uncharacterized protein LOC121417366 [Lytechinus variegatus]|uniref:uncharacterized protein LOC121417366 n=1 Tax=Lytechinus variegatus TaxID=7654 RepID=UPI001BB24467|nr:uncharacterized protein LOC121417366 [Lytechinus variegatus]